MDPNVEEEAEEETTYVKLDRYGFQLGDQFHQRLQISDEEQYSRKEKERNREIKWIDMMKEWNYIISGDNAWKTNMLQRRIRKGIPDCIRGRIWGKLLKINTMSKKYRRPEQQECDSLPPIVREDIVKDIDRTFPSHIMFKENNGFGQEALRQLLECYAVVDPETAYCQGMSFIAAMLLTYMPEDQAFVAFCCLMNVSRVPIHYVIMLCV